MSTRGTDPAPFHVAWVWTRTAHGTAEVGSRVLSDLVGYAASRGVGWLTVQVPDEGLLGRVRSETALPAGALWAGDQGAGDQGAGDRPPVDPPAEGGGSEDALVRVDLVPGASGRKRFVETIAALASRSLHEGVEEQEIGIALAVPDVDLLVLTGGDRHLPDLLLWQVVYSEIVVIDAPWPVVGGAHFEEALADYARRNRRYGGLGSRT